jgi:hypothetical protein
LLAILMAVVMRQYNTARIAQWRRCHHRASTCSESINVTLQCPLFWTSHLEKGLQLTCWPLITIGVWHIKLMRST